MFILENSLELIVGFLLCIWVVNISNKYLKMIFMIIS